LALHELFSSGSTLSSLSGLLSLSELTISVGITSGRSSSVDGTSSISGSSLLLRSSRERKRWGLQSTLELVSSPLVRVGLTSLPRFVEFGLVSEVLGVGSSLLSPSDLLLGVGPLRVELSNRLRLVLSLLLFTSRSSNILSLRSTFGLSGSLGRSGSRLRGIFSLLLDETLSPNTIANIVEGGSGLWAVMVSTCLVDGGFEYLHFLGSLLSKADGLGVVGVNSEERSESTILVGREITLVSVVVLRSMSRTIGLISGSRPRLDIDGLLDQVADGGANRVSTLTFSACDIRSLVNEITVGELSSDVDESRLVFSRGSGLRSSLQDSAGLATSSVHGTISVSWEVTLVASVRLDIVGGSRGSSRPWLNINSFLNDIANGGTDGVGTLSSSAVDIFDGLLSNRHNWFFTPDTGSRVVEDGGHWSLLLSVESGVLSVDNGVKERNLVWRRTKILLLRGLGFSITNWLFIGIGFSTITRRSSHLDSRCRGKQ